MNGNSDRNCTKLVTPGEISARLGVPISRVLYVLKSRPQIVPVGRAGTLRVYDRSAIESVRHELSAINSKRSST